MGDVPEAGPAGADVARDLVAALSARGLRVATGESLTGGLVCATLVDVPGASACVLGGVVGYAYAVKSALLGVPADLLARRGAVNADVAARLALGAMAATGADVGIGTTGAAGPSPSDGEAPGTVFVAVAGLTDEPVVRRLGLDGDRAAVRRGAVDAVLALALDLVGGLDAPASGAADGRNAQGPTRR